MQALNCNDWESHSNGSIGDAQGVTTTHTDLSRVTQPFNPKRLLLEILLLVACAEICVTLVLPRLETGLGPLGEALLNIALLLLLAAPAAYWRFMVAFKTVPGSMQIAPMAYGKSRHALVLTAATQFVGLVLTASGVLWQGKNLQSISQSRFEQGTERIETEVVRRLNQPVYGLKGARGAMAATPHFSRKAFRAYVASRDLPSEFPGIRGFGYIQHVPRAGLQRFVAAQHAEGAPDFAVRTGGTADDLFVVTYVEPLQANSAALGFDMGQEATRRAALEYAMDTGEPTLLSGIALMQDKAHSPGLLFLLPVYRAGSHPQTQEERRRDLLGMLYAPIVASELLGSVAASTESMLDFELFDGTQLVPEKRLLDTRAQAAADASETPGATQAPSFTAERVHNVGSQVLTLRTRSTARFDAAQDRSSLLLIGAGGALVSLLMAIAVWLLAVGRQRARDLAQAMTSELDRMARVVQHTDNAVTIMDRDMRIEWVNQGFTRITGYGIEEARGKTPGELLSSGQSTPEALQTLLDGAQRGVACRVELINRARDGHVYWANTEVQPMLNALGELVGFMEIGTDISQQKVVQHQLEAAVRDARALQVTVEMHAIVSTTDALGRITDVNDAFCRISGHAREALLGQNHRILASNVQGPEFWSHLWQTIGAGRPWRGEICNRSKDGALYWVDSMVAPFVGDDGHIEKFVSISTDITARHQSAEKLRQSEATFAASFQDAATGMGLLSPKGQWLMANPAMCEFLGLTQDELHAITLIDVSHPEEWDTDAQQMQRLLDGEIRVYQRAKRYVHREGHMVWGLASVSAVRNEGGVVEFVIAQIVDITARKRAEEALGLSNALMEESQAIAKVGGWELNLVSGTLYWTQETFRIHETTPDDFNPTVDAGLGLYLPESRARIAAAVEAAIHTGQGYDLELQTLTTKGNCIDVRTTCTATLENGQVVHLSGIFQDITERKEYERSLREAREKAELATLGKGQFLANMSHEIRTPMNAILGMLKLLHNTDLNHRQRDYAEKTEHAAKSLLSLINDILDFSKVEAGKMALDPQPFRITHLMRSLSVILSSNLGPNSVEVLFDIDPRIPDVLLGDAMRLQQVLINLGGNAVKFTPQGQVVVSLKLSALAAATAHVEFAVQDSGIGIAPEHQAHIFTGFSQAEASTTRKFGGTGLGLAISQRMVELMGGTLQLHSALGLGSTFFFTLQLPVVHPVPAELEEAALLPPPQRRALVVDSNAVARTLLAGMVQSWGWSAQACDSGEAALALIEARMGDGGWPFDVVYLDWHMAGMDGWATAKRLRQMYASSGAPQPVVVMVSGNSREALEQRTLEEQNMLNGFLVKPVTASMLLEAALEPGASQARMRQGRRSAARQRRLLGMRILVVEDNLINQQVAEELLVSEGALVSLAANGRLGVDAIAAARQGPQFDVVLMDIQMPVLDGFAATRLVRQELQLTALPIVAMTANAMDSDRDACLAVGMNAHVGKPFELKALVQTLLAITGYQPPQAQPEPPGEAPLPAPLPAPFAAPVSAAGLPCVLDVSTALTRMGGLQSLYLRSARDFLAQLAQQSAELRAQALAAPQQGARLAHALRGTAAVLGAVALADTTALLERQCLAGAPHASRAATVQALEQVVLETLAHLRETIARMQAAAAPPASGPVHAEPARLDKSAVQAVLGRLVGQLQAADLAALDTFTASRDLLAATPQATVQALDDALHGLDLQSALASCQALQTWLHNSPDSQEQIRDT